MDVLFVTPGSHSLIYQDLAKDYSAIEPPTWALLLAESCRSVGYAVAILDANAERLEDAEAVRRVEAASPRLVCFVLHGQNPNSGTMLLEGAIRLARAIKAAGTLAPICFVGPHVSALPYEVLGLDCVDLILANEGVYALRSLLAAKDLHDTRALAAVKGIGYKNGAPRLTAPEQVVPDERMDQDLPGYAWDLLPFRTKPLDLYRSHFWHAEYDHAKRTPFAAVYTSLGCFFRCSFCMVNVVNRNDNEPIGVASRYNVMRHFSPDLAFREIARLAAMGVRTLRISDEMFLLSPKHYVPLCEKLRDSGLGRELSMWAYSRVDTIRSPERMDLLRAAGIRWLCLGIESADRGVRLEVTKGKFEDVDIRKVVAMLADHGIDVMANYMFGLPGDTLESMQATLDLGLELNTVGWNGYAAMALPGSELYKTAIERGCELPRDFSGYSFHAYETLPLPTATLTPAQVLEFRDRAFTAYHTHPPFLAKIEAKYGSAARANIEAMTRVKLKRRLLGD